MKTHNIVLGILVILTLASCRNTKAITTEVKEVITTVERIDTVYVVEPDTVLFRVPVEVIADKPKTFETDRQKVTVAIDTKTGELVVDAQIKEVEVPIEMERTTTTEREEKVREKTKEAPKNRGLWWKIPLLAVICFVIGVFYGKFA